MKVLKLIPKILISPATDNSDDLYCHFHRIV